MTLADLIPSLRSSLLPRQLDREIWPLTTRHGHGGLSIGGVPLMCIEQEFGTPTYIIDEADIHERCTAYAAAFGAPNVVYAAKALVCRGLCSSPRLPNRLAPIGKWVGGGWQPPAGYDHAVAST